MKKLLDTKPTYVKVIATEDGWVDEKTGEILVAIKNLKSRLGDDINTLAKRGRGRPKKIKD
jgi:hypothetical protein